MLEINESEIKFKTISKPISAIEVDVDSIPEGLCCRDIIENVLRLFASDDNSICATVFLRESQSVNFHDFTYSMFIGVSGSREIFDKICDALRLVNGLRSKISEYVLFTNLDRFFHVQDGYLWRPSENLTWEACGVNCENSANSGASENSEDVEEGEDPEVITRKHDSDPLRYRHARSDARVGNMKRIIEGIFGLPEGSVSLVGPDRKSLRADALIATLRKRWEDS